MDKSVYLNQKVYTSEIVELQNLFNVPMERFGRRGVPGSDTICLMDSLVNPTVLLTFVCLDTTLFRCCYEHPKLKK